MVYKDWMRRVSAWLLPPRCVACDSPAVTPDIGTDDLDSYLYGADPTPLDLCRDCAGLMPLNRNACVRCAIPLPFNLPGDTPGLLCGQCLRRPPLFHRACCALRYEYPARHLIQQLKYRQGLAQGRVLSTILAKELQRHYRIHHERWPECIVPVPLHARRYRSRGYNQVIEVGKGLSQRLGIELRTDMLTRVRDTPEQVGLNRKERRRNLRGAFQVVTRKLPAHIALLDDVITTGSTVGEISKQLRRAGVQQIDVWGLARAAWRSSVS